MKNDFIKTNRNCDEVVKSYYVFHFLVNVNYIKFCIIQYRFNNIEYRINNIKKKTSLKKYQCLINLR